MIQDWHVTFFFEILIFDFARPFERLRSDAKQHPTVWLVAALKLDRFYYTCSYLNEKKILFRLRLNTIKLIKIDFLPQWRLVSRFLSTLAFKI